MGKPTEIRVVGTVLGPSGPVAGRLTFVSETLVRDNATDDVMTPQTIVCTVGTDGGVDVLIPSTDDPGFSPTGWTWSVRPHFDDWRTPFDVAIPYDSPDGELELSAMVEVPPDGDGQLYALVNHTHEGGGGGSDILPSGTVASSTVYSQGSTAGVATTYSRGDHRHGTPALPTPADIGASSTGHNHSGTYDPAGTAASAVAAHEADTTSVHGIANTANLVLTGDSRLSDSRTPTAHHTSHEPGGGDPMAVDAGAGVGSLRTLGTGSAQAAAGNHNHSGTYQPLDGDLTTIASLTPTTDNFMVAAASAWASRTPAQARTALQVVPIIVLASGDPIPGGTPAGTVVVRTA